MGGGIGASANLDVWIVLGAMVVGAALRAWNAFHVNRDSNDADAVGPEDTAEAGLMNHHQGPNALII